MRLSGLLVLLLALAGCAVTVLPGRVPPAPEWTLAPAQLPGAFLHQRLRFERAGVEQVFDALLEIEAEALRLAAFAAQQPAFRLHWDGRRLDSDQAAWLPAEFRPRWVLNDLLLLLAPIEALRAQLPPGWQLHERAGARELRWQGQTVARARRDGDHWSIEQRGLGYRLQIDNAAAAMPP